MPATTSVAKAWCSVTEAADYLGVHHTFIRRLVAEGRVEAMRVGGRMIRIRIASLESAGTRMGA
ncbi:hypothetical protein RAJCM14343_2743 [Rhodococcus aetherivorans]|uniref:Helix-turn-helix domain-containing protein n=1 Tax=Rhodococcus aetherivorans TaxID=191292 RepID=A0ABQ0YLQ5_9NOCA|nr:DNA binding domain protein, excisionase family [Rhodococcus rhodochrous ATCC 21198]NGP27278.1 helix-turn-helix domain-containing protein [Rhodococcus aetherivorans]GES37488.1 hypothetical protein RAJCM14343_2743 [Rhodococcus aetherivorans]